MGTHTGFYILKINKAIILFRNFAYAGSNRRLSMSTRAGLNFPCGKFKRMLKARIHGARIQRGSAIYAAAVTEYLVAEILDLAKDAAKSNKKKR